MKKNHDLPSEPHAQTSETAAAVDKLISNVLDNIRLKGAVFFSWQPRWPFATGVPEGRYFRDLILPSTEQIISYHIVVKGPCWAVVSDNEPVRLNSGDILLVPNGDAYAISDRPRSPSHNDIKPARQFFSMMASGELPLVIADGGTGPEQNQLVCGFLGCDRQPYNPIFNELPNCIVLARSALDGSINELIDIVLKECAQPHVGSRCMMIRLGELLFIEVLRHYLLDCRDKHNAWIQGLADPLVAKTLSLLHGRIAEDWTLEKLAAESGSSRSTIAEHFHALIGVPPMQYLTLWRMQSAARMLREEQEKILSIAREVGYDSEAAFSRAFKRIVGVSPSVWRRYSNTSQS